MPEVGFIRQGISRYQPLPTTNVIITTLFLSIIPSKSNGFCAFRFATARPYGKSGIFAVFVRFGAGPYGKSGIFADFVRFGRGRVRVPKWVCGK